MLEISFLLVVVIVVALGVSISPTERYDTANAIATVVSTKVCRRE